MGTAPHGQAVRDVPLTCLRMSRRPRASIPILPSAVRSMRLLDAQGCD